MENNKIILRCVCCGFEIEPFDEISSSDLSSEMWKDGIVGEISGNFGSDFDGDIYTIAICDSCIKEKQDKGLLKYKGNYLYNADETDQK